MKTGHLFAGAGGGLLADKILGHEPVFAVEWNTYACDVLRARARSGWFPGLHVHEGDIRLFDPSEYAGRVDCIHAGFPCQDISVAGGGAGIEGERSGLWSEVVRVVHAIRPAKVFIENSPAIVSRGLVVVLSDLADLGFDAQWCVLPASAVGAPHFRARWFCLATLADSNRITRTQRKAHHTAERQKRQNVGRGGGAQDVRHPDGAGLEKWKNWAENAGAEQEPPAFGANWWEFEPDVGRVVNGMAARAHRITAIGNSQVPLQAAATYRL